MSGTRKHWQRQGCYKRISAKVHTLWYQGHLQLRVKPAALGAGVVERRLRSRVVFDIELKRDCVTNRSIDLIGGVDEILSTNNNRVYGGERVRCRVYESLRQKRITRERNGEMHTRRRLARPGVNRGGVHRVVYGDRCSDCLDDRGWRRCPSR